MFQFLPDIGKHPVTLIGMQLIIQTAQGNSDHITMMQSGAELVAQFQPKIVNQVEILRPETRRVRSKVYKNRWPAGRDDLQRKRMAGFRQSLPCAANAAG